MDRSIDLAVQQVQFDGFQISIMGAASFAFIVALASPAFGQTKDIKLPGSNSNSPDTKVARENNCHQR